MTIFRTLVLLVALWGTSLSFGADPSTVNINTADAATLAAVLHGVGESKARAIVAYREQYGDFKAVEELTAVKGIGEALLRDNAGRIVLK